MQAIKNNNNDRLTRQRAPVAHAFDRLDSHLSKERYTEKIEAFFDYIGLEGNSLEEKGLAFLAKANQEVIDNNTPYWIEDNIENFLKHHKERLKKGEIVANTLETYYWPIKVFCDRNKLTLPRDIDWDNLSKIIPKTSSYSNDRCPTVQEIRRVIKNPNRRVKPIVLVMCSSGIRLGAWDYLKWKHVIPITNSQFLHLKKQKEEDENGHSGNITITSDDESKIIAAKLIVYNDGEGDNSHQHFSYITPEAYYALKEMIDYREQVQGEKITGESWLITNEKVGFATAPKKLTYNGLRRVLNRTLKTEGLRSVLPKGKRRYEWKQSHGYRKFFETYAGSVMHPYNVKMLIDHKLEGSENSYWKPTELQLLEDYLRAIPKLTINNHQDIDKSILQKEVAELKEKSEQQNTEKEKEAEETKKKLAELEAQQQERFKEMEEKMESLRKIAVKQAFRVIEKEVETNPPPYIEGADKKMTAQEVLYEMKKRGCNTWEG